MRKSRRRFLRLAAAGAAALAAAPAAAAAAPAKRVKRPAAKPAPPAPPSAVVAEIEKQKGYVAQSLKALRGYALDDAIEPAGVFVPLRPARGGKGR
jgi:ABC-type sugar transport system substrate-binding protein